MKKLFLVGALALFGAMNAQSAKFGLNAGMLTGFAKAKVPGYNETDSSTGFYVGALVELKFGSFAIQPAVNYANISDGSGLQIPVMLKYYAIPKLNFQFGPQFLFDLEDTPAGYEDFYNKTNFGLALGAGFDFTSSLFAEARYSFQVNNHLKDAPSGYALKANYFNLGLGYKF